MRDPSFRLGVVTGDSGAGKSSLLEAGLADGLEALGVSVVLVRSIDGILPAEAPRTPAAGIGKVLEAISREIALREQEKPSQRVVVILDQFEEILTRWRASAARRTFGAYIRDEIARDHRFVLGIRREYLVDLREIVAPLPTPPSLRDTILVSNFEPHEAASVIRECARRDQLECDEALPELIARDLTVDGAVRPADLQVVCQALRGQLSVDRYRREGGAVGLRSRFVKDIVGRTGDPVLARTVLRALCDIPNNKKQPMPLSAGTIAAGARAGAPGARATDGAVENLLIDLEEAYVVVREASSEMVGWSLIHDYLAEPIKLATEEQATRGEAAVAEMEYFLRKSNAGGHVVIPLGRLKEISRDLPPLFRREPPVRRLIRRSAVVGYCRPTGLAATAGLLAAALIFAVATDWDRWEAWGPALSHFEGRDRNSTLTAIALRAAASDRIALINFRGESLTSIWDTANGARIAMPATELSAADGYLWSYDPGVGVIHRFGPDGKQDRTFTTGTAGRPPGKLIVVGAADEWVMLSTDTHSFHQDRNIVDVQTGRWTISKGVYGEALGCDSTSSWDRTLGDFRVLLVSCYSKPVSRLIVENNRTGSSIADIDLSTSDVDLLPSVDIPGATFLSVAVGGIGVETFVIRHGAPEDKGQPAITFEVRQNVPFPKDLSWDFHPNYGKQTRLEVMRVGSWIAIARRESMHSAIWRFDPQTGRFTDPLFSAVPAAEVENAAGLAWEADDGTAMLWPRDRAEPVGLPGMKILPTDTIVLSGDSQRLLMVHKELTGDLWQIDLGKSNAKHLARIAVEDAKNIAFSNDDRLVLVYQVGGETVRLDACGRRTPLAWPAGGRRHLVVLRSEVRASLDLDR